MGQSPQRLRNSAPAVPRTTVLLHGFTGSAGSWGEPILDGLDGEGVDVVAVDLPGHGSRTGDRDPREFTLDAALAGLDDAVEDRAGETAEGGSVEGRGGPQAPEPRPRYDLVGYSMGGRVALHQAFRRPDRVGRLILESASPGLETEDERTRRRAADEALARRIAAEDIDAFVDRWEALPLFASQRHLPEDVRHRHRARRLANDPRSLAAALRGLGTGTLPSLWDRLAEIGTPTLLIVGDLDRKFVGIGRRMAEAMPDARLVVVPDAGHTVHLERPEAWLELVSDFLGA